MLWCGPVKLQVLVRARTLYIEANLDRPVSTYCASGSERTVRPWFSSLRLPPQTANKVYEPMLALSWRVPEALRFMVLGVMMLMVFLYVSCPHNLEPNLTQPLPC